jgi:hypothetical protein
MPVHNRIATIPKEDGSGGFEDFRGALVVQGPILPVQIEVPAPLAQQLQLEGKPVPSPVAGIALVDTGAGVSGIDASVIAQLGVQPVGQVMVSGVTGAKMRSKFPAKFTFPGTGLPDFNFGELVEAEIANQAIRGTKIPLIALIGRDILHHCVVVYNGPAGTFTIAC